MGLPGYQVATPANCPSQWKAPKNRDQLRKILHWIALFHPLINMTPNRYSCVLYSGEFVLYSTLWRIIHSNAIISLKISPTLCVCGYHILIEPVITPNYNSIHFDCRPSLKPTKVWTLWRPMPLRDRAPLLDVCREKVNNDKKRIPTRDWNAGERSVHRCTQAKWPRC